MLQLPSSPSMGVFMPAHWTVPQNPITGWPSLAAIVAGLDFSYPSNGVVAEIQAKQKVAEELTKNPNGPVGLSCGPTACPCSLGYCGSEIGMSGLGSTLDDVLSGVTSGGWQTWAIAGAAVLALVMLTGGGGAQRSSELAAAKAKYKSEVARIRAARPRRYQKYV
jgi:hypothetical protein